MLKLVSSNSKLFIESCSQKKRVYKIGISDSPLCSFCKLQDESIEHLFWGCEFVKSFWNCLFDWLNSCSVKVEDISEMDIIIGNLNENEDELLINHISILAKYFIYRNSLISKIPLFSVFKHKISYVFDIESRIADKTSFHLSKWNKLIDKL